MAAQQILADQTFIDSVECLSRAQRFVDRLTVRHEILVGKLTAALAPLLGYSTEMAETIGYAARLHDIGKIAIPPAILHKAAPLTAEELRQVHKHSLYGAEILGISNNPLYRLAGEIALHHHEHVDGSGYPHGLSGDSIPLPARIVAVCDTYEALRSQRPYKRSFGHEEAHNILTQGDDRVSPTFFDERVLHAYCRMEQRIKTIYEEHVATEPTPPEDAT